MKGVTASLAFLISDRFIFPAFEIALLSIFLFALAKSRGLFRNRGGVVAIVQRGEESWQKIFNIGFGIASLIILQVVWLSEFAKGYKVAAWLVDVGCLLYLTFFNAWFRNKVIGLIMKSKKLKERF